jgi:putative secretion ATPase (PEP-CTERM system associated)
MYERFYNLRERPFSLSPDPDYLYPSRVHTEALNYLRYGIEGHAGFVVITGEVGSGKTTLLQTALRGIDRRTSVARLVNTMLDARELIEAVMLDFGLEPQAGQSKPHLLRDLARFLVDQRTAGRLALLIIDEAQNLSQAALEEIRMLSNLETEKSKLIQIVLVGQPNLQEVLARPELEQLRQRVTVRYHLRPLDPSETAAYINHRLRKAAIGAPLEFPTEVTNLIGQASHGLPRKINVIADAVLLFGYGEDKRIIDAPLVREVLAELEETGVIPSASSRVSPSASIAVSAPPVLPEAAPLVESTTSAQAAARELALREARIEQRERELAEQQRVLTEQYRLMKVREAQVAASAARVPTWPPQAAPSTSAAITGRGVSVPVAAPTPVAAASSAFRATTTDGVAEVPFRTSVGSDQARARANSRTSAAAGFWTRVRRGLFGVRSPVFED